MREIIGKLLIFVFGKYQGIIEVSRPVAQLGFFCPENYSEATPLVKKLKPSLPFSVKANRYQCIRRKFVARKIFFLGNVRLLTSCASDLNIKTYKKDIKKNIIHHLCKCWKNC